MQNPEIDLRAVAGQLANPSGEFGIEIARRMNESNGAMTEQAIAYTAIVAGDRVLEIGPGNGKFATLVLGCAPDVYYTGVDISDTMIAQATSLNQEGVDLGNVQFELINGVDLPFEDYTFDKVFTVNTLYFWEDPLKNLAEIYRVLKPGGVFCLAFSSKAFMQTLPFTAYGFTLYEPVEVQQLLKEANFQVENDYIRQHPTISAAKQEVMREEVFLLARTS